MEKSKLKIKECFKKFKFLFVIFILTISAAQASAAKLYLEPKEGQYSKGDIFITEIKIDTEGEEINTIKAGLTFPQNNLEAKDFSKGNSILTLWVGEPIFSNQSGTIYFTGGIPNGYKGNGGLLGKIIFQVKGGTEAYVQFEEDSQVLLNDGFGTPSKLNTEGGFFIILPEGKEIQRNEWQEELKKDNIPPEIFKIEISKNSTVFDDKYFISFFTIDKQTGIDHYEIKEGRKDWQIGESPYLLKDQSLINKIFVKAVDKAGNERISELIPRTKLLMVLIIIATLLIIVIISLTIKRFF